MSPLNSDMSSRNHRFHRKALVIWLVIFLSGCAGASAVPSPVLSTPTASPSPTSSLTSETTFTSITIRPPYLTTRTEAGTLKPTNTKLFVPHGTPLPTTFPTPTRGLASTATLSPKQECPPPTYEKVDIAFTQDIRDYGPQIRKYFQANGDRADLEQQLEKLGGNDPDIAQFTEADVTGDQVKETIITLKQLSTIGFSGTVDMEVFVIGCRDGQYQLLSGGNNFFIMGADPVQAGVLDILDINADGIMEIVLWDTYYWHSAHGDVSHLYNILEWNGDRFRPLFEQVEDSGGYKWVEVMNDRLETQDVDNNGTTEVLLPDWSGFTCGFGPVKITKSIYMWDGENYRYMWTDPGVPYYQFQAAFAGDYFSEIALYDKAEHFYRRVMEDTTLKPYLFDNNQCGGRNPSIPGDPNNVLAYTRFRYVELLAFLGKESEAENQVNQLEEKFSKPGPGYQYALLVETFWKEYQPEKDIESACAAVRDEASRRPDEIFDPLYFGYQDPGPTIETICPFHSD